MAIETLWGGDEYKKRTVVTISKAWNTEYAHLSEPNMIDIACQITKQFESI